MRDKHCRNLNDVRTHTRLSGEAKNPHRRFLAVANLELKRALCIRLRSAAQKRVDEMDKEIAELEAEAASLLAIGKAPSGRPMPPTEVPAHGVTLRY